MRSVVTAVTIVGLAAGIACAQMKTQPQPAPAGATTAAPAAPHTELPNEENAKRIARDEAMKLVKEDKAIWVDVRGKEAYELSHIKGAISIPLTEIPTRYKELPKKKMIIAYCA